MSRATYTQVVHWQPRSPMLRGILGATVIILVQTIFRAHLPGPGGLYTIQIPAVNALVGWCILKENAKEKLS